MNWGNGYQGLNTVTHFINFDTQEPHWSHTVNPAHLPGLANDHDCIDAMSEANGLDGSHGSASGGEQNANGNVTGEHSRGERVRSTVWVSPERKSEHNANRTVMNHFPALQTANVQLPSWSR